MNIHKYILSKFKKHSILTIYFINKKYIKQRTKEKIFLNIPLNLFM